ncbi:MAG: hypothetical protein JWO09_3052 [Bacteroidetes bacterium]|nr:hypothetical protein [Bacteroidota bacterium]
MILGLTFYFFGILLFIASLVRVVMEKKSMSGQFISYVIKGHFICLALTAFLIFLWSFNIHLPGKVLEILPFWLFIFSGVFVFGFARLHSFKKAWFGFVFFAHLFFSLIAIIPFIGTGITIRIYSYFMPDDSSFETEQFRIQEEVRGIMSPMGSPYVYIKCGLYELKYETDIEPVYNLDSVSLQKLDDKNMLLRFYDSDDPRSESGRVQNDTIACGCL